MSQNKLQLKWRNRDMKWLIFAIGLIVGILLGALGIIIWLLKKLESER